MSTVGQIFKEKRRAAQINTEAPRWFARVPQPTLFWIAISLVALKLLIFLVYGRLLGNAIQCSLQQVDAPLWNTSFEDWRELARFSDSDDEAALAVFAGPLEKNGSFAPPPLILTHATRANAALALHWACALRRTEPAVEPRIVALDGAATCASLLKRAPWLRCLALDDGAHQNQNRSALGRAHALHVALQQRARVAWRLLARGHDIVVADSDVVFLKPFLHAARVAARGADIAMLERHDAWRFASALKIAQPSFALVFARSNARSVAFYQLLQMQQAVERRSAADVYALCMRPPWRQLRIAHLAPRLFWDAPQRGGSNNETERASVVAVHVHGASVAQKIESMRQHSVWNACDASI